MITIDALKSYQENVKTKILHKETTKSSKLLCINCIPMQRYFININYEKIRPLQVKLSVLKEYLSNYYDIYKFVSNEQTESQKEDKETLLAITSGMDNMDCRHKVLYDLRKSLESDMRIPTLESKLCYCFISSVQYIKDDLTLVVKSSFYSEEQPYFYPIREENGVVFFIRNPNIIGLKDELARVYNNSFMSYLQKFDDAKWLPLITTRHTSNMILYEAYSINTVLFNDLMPNYLIKSNEYSLHSIGLNGQKAYNYFLAQILLADLELNEYFLTKKYRASASYTYTYSNMLEYKPILIDSSFMKNILCSSLSNENTARLIDILDEEVLPKYAIGNYKVKYLCREPITKTITSKDIDGCTSYYLTRNEIYLMSGVFCHDVYRADSSVLMVYSYRYTALKLYRSLVELAKDKIDNSLYDIFTTVLNLVENTKVQFNEDWSNYTLNCINADAESKISIPYEYVSVMQMLNRLGAGKYKEAPKDLKNRLDLAVREVLFIDNNVRSIVLNNPDRVLEAIKQKFNY